MIPRSRGLAWRFPFEGAPPQRLSGQAIKSARVGGGVGGFWPGRCTESGPVESTESKVFWILEDAG